MDSILERFAAPFAAEVLDAFPALVVQGARQVGKSTFARQLVVGRDALSLTLDDEQVLDAAEGDPAAFVGQRPSGTMVIDEVQRAPRLMLAVKSAIDRDRRPGRFILTGSSNLLRRGRSSDSLAGRAVTVELHPFSQGELRGRRDDFLARLRDGIDATRSVSEWGRADYAAAIARGGYPEAQGRGAALRNAWFDSYAERLVEHDALDIARRISSERVAAMLRLLAARHSGELVKARLARDAGLPESSANAYLDVLDAMYLIRRLPPWTPNVTSREVARPKVFVEDAGLALRLARIPEKQLLPLTSAHIGQAIEGFVVGELMKQREWSDEEYELFHYRDRDGLEVDVVVEFGDGSVIGLEIKAGTTAKWDHFKGLRAVQSKLGDRFLGGYVLNTAQTGAFFGEHLASLPISTLWEV